MYNGFRKKFRSKFFGYMMLNVFLVHVNLIIFSVKTMHFIDHI